MLSFEVRADNLAALIASRMSKHTDVGPNQVPTRLGDASEFDESVFLLGVAAFISFRSAMSRRL